jgi:hypothetical protein
MKFTIGYTVWNKVDMVSWLLEGIINTFSPADTEVVFHFDACTDGSDAAFDSLVPYWLMRRGGFRPEQIHKIVSRAEVREVGGHNALMHWFMERQGQFLIVAQDDQQLKSPPCPFIEKLAKTYGKDLGLIGGRDGYGVGYTNFTGSQWSESAVQHRLGHGEFVALPYMNSGPIVYNARLISEVGFLDEEYRAYYVWDDYGHRALQKGFVNGVMGMDLIHAKFGRVKATEWCDWSGHDLALRQQKHGF